MTLDEIRALGTTTLNLAIERHCYSTHQWQEECIPDTEVQRWTLQAPDVEGKLWSTVPHLHYTASWDRTMALAWRYLLSLRPTVGHAGHNWIVEAMDGHAIIVRTEDEARRTLCQLALLVQLQQEREG